MIIVIRKRRRRPGMLSNMKEVGMFMFWIGVGLAIWGIGLVYFFHSFFTSL